MTATLVVGLGQPLAGDDAAGLAVAERLRTEGIPAVTVPDGAALVDVLAEAPRAVILDAVVGGGPPGTVVHLRAADLLDLSGPVPVSSHGLRVADAVAVARALGGPSDVHLIGIAIDPASARPDPARGHGAGAVSRVTCALGPAGEAALSPEVAAALDEAAARVRALLAE